MPRKPKENQSEQTETGGPDRTRTCDLRFRKPLLYPAELRDLLDFSISYNEPFIRLAILASP
jgi:hypothetical protein